ncbi:MAG TPA: MFS transporter, partial [Gaiellaceae bacterium]|nr:MFS transporter [Gaiellaceae bacterium]
MKLGSTLLDGCREVVAPEGGDVDAVYRARLLLLLTAALALDYADRACVGALGPDLKHEFAISNTGFGLLASAFAVVGGLATVPAGILTDRARRTLVRGAGMLLRGDGCHRRCGRLRDAARGTDLPGRGDGAGAADDR